MLCNKLPSNSMPKKNKPVVGPLTGLQADKCWLLWIQAMVGVKSVPPCLSQPLWTNSNLRHILFRELCRRAGMTAQILSKALLETATKVPLTKASQAAKPMPKGVKHIRSTARMCMCVCSLNNIPKSQLHWAQDSVCAYAYMRPMWCHLKFSSKHVLLIIYLHCPIPQNRVESHYNFLLPK